MSDFLVLDCNMLYSIHLLVIYRHFLFVIVACFALDLRLQERVVSSNLILLELHKCFLLVIVTALNTHDGGKRRTDVGYIS